MKSPTSLAVYLPPLLRAIFNPYSWLDQKPFSNLWLYSSPIVLSNPSGDPRELHLKIYAEYDTFLSLVWATTTFAQLTIIAFQHFSLSWAHTPTIQSNLFHTYVRSSPQNPPLASDSLRRNKNVLTMASKVQHPLANLLLYTSPSLCSSHMQIQQREEQMNWWVGDAALTLPTGQTGSPSDNLTWRTPLP